MWDHIRKCFQNTNSKKAWFCYNENMKVGDLLYKQAIEQGYNPNLLKGLISNIDKSLESYKKAFESMKEPHKRIISDIEYIKPKLKELQKIQTLHVPETKYSFSDIEDCFIKPQDRIQKVEITNIDEIISNSNNKKADVVTASYILPKNATWESLHIKFLDGHVVKIEYPGMKTKKFDFKDMGFLNGKTMMPDMKWILLQAIAGSEGALTNAKWDKRFSRNVKYELNEKLKKFFGMKTSPIPHYTKRHGYQPLFTIRPDR